MPRYLCKDIIVDDGAVSIAVATIVADNKKEAEDILLQEIALSGVEYKPAEKGFEADKDETIITLAKQLKNRYNKEYKNV